MAAPGASSPDELPIDVELIKVLASDSRRDILRQLGERRKTLTELSDSLGLKKATVIEHLQKLVVAGLIRKLDGDDRLWIYYELSPRGKRLVRPERTRFYLILGGTAAAALILGAAVAASVLIGPFGPQADDVGTPPMMGEASDAGKAFDARDTAAPRTAWRGLDEQIDFRFADAPADAYLVLRAGGQGGAEEKFAIRDGVASMDPSRLDALRPDAYRLSLASGAGEVSLGESFLVRDPPIAIHPRVVLAGTPTSIEVVMVPAGYAPPANATVRLGLAEYDFAGQSFAVLRADLMSATPLRVGRLFTTPVATLPAYEVAFTRQGSELEIRLAGRGQAISGADIILDGTTMGITDADGRMLAPWPENGERALRIIGPDGVALDVPIRVDPESIIELAPALRIEALDARAPGAKGLRLRADVFNDGPAETIVTVAAREGDALLASTLASVPAHGRVEVLLESELATPQIVEVTAHSARASVALRSAGDASSRESAATAPVGAPAGSANYAYAHDKSAEPSGVVARATILYELPFATLAPGDAAEKQTAAVPGVPAVLAVAVAAFAALLVMRRHP